MNKSLFSVTVAVAIVCLCFASVEGKYIAWVYICLCDIIMSGTKVINEKNIFPKLSSRKARWLEQAQAQRWRKAEQARRKTKTSSSYRNRLHI